jgi:hypothetical protein
MRMKMTKRHHVCDETCEPEGTGIHNVKSNAKKTKKVAKKPKVVKKEIKPEVVNVYANKPNPAKIEAIWKIIDIVDQIGNEHETNKVLEKTLITLRKLQKDIAN